MNCGRKPRRLIDSTRGSSYHRQREDATGDRCMFGWQERKTLQVTASREQDAECELQSLRALSTEGEGLASEASKDVFGDGAHILGVCLAGFKSTQ